MSNFTKRVEGAAQAAAGTIEQDVGKLIGNERIEAEGHAKKLAGQTKQEAAKVAERIKGTVEELSGVLKTQAGEALGSARMRASGKAKELKGLARQKANR